MKITRNEEFKGLEVSFEKKPSTKVLNQLKQNGFRWHSKKKVWYAKETKERYNFLQSLDENVEVEEQKQIENKFGIKVGDIYYISWGWEQTNVDFFKVVKVTEKSVRVIEISPIKKDIEVISSMSQNFKIETNKIYKGSKNPFFIKDNVNGDLKRLNDYGSFYIKEYLAFKYKNEPIYESWYA